MAKRILVIEDDADIRRNLKRLLESEGYAVQTAVNGETALEHLTNDPSPPSLILLDLMMPTMDGYEFRERQSRLPGLAGIPLVIMTAGGDIEDKRVRLGAQAALRKPVGIDDVLGAVERFSRQDS